MPDTNNGLPEGAVVGPSLKQPEGLPEGAVVGPSLKQPEKQPEQPSTWQVLTQPTETTDKEYMGYRGPAGVAGATVHGLNRVAEETKNAAGGLWEMGKDIVRNPDRPLIAPDTEGKYKGQETIVQKYNPLKGLGRIGEVPAAVHDINASPSPLTHYGQAAEDTAAQGAGQTLTALGTEAGVKSTAKGLGKVADVVDTVKQAKGTELGKIATDEAKQYALRKLPFYDVVKTAKRIANKVSDLKEADKASALGKTAEPDLISSPAKPKAAGYKPMALPEEPAPELKPLGTKTAEPEESTAVRQARHTVGNSAVNKLKDVEGGPEVLQRLHKGSYQNYADLANALELEKPSYLKARNGETWQPSEFKRSVQEHGRELSGPKETVIRELLAKPPKEILQHTKPWADSTAKYPTKMGSLTERTMGVLGLGEQARNDMRMSGTSDTEAQSLLARLSRRQLNNLS
jgi:hypothetical protein